MKMLTLLTMLGRALFPPPPSFSRPPCSPSNLRSGHRLRLPRGDRQPVQPLISSEEVLQGVAPPEPLPPCKRRAKLGGMCCDCCAAGGMGALLTGKFPNFSTGNQFFSPSVFANVCRLGFELADEPVREMMQRRDHTAALARASQQPPAQLLPHAPHPWMPLVARGAGHTV